MNAALMESGKTTYIPYPTRGFLVGNGTLEDLLSDLEYRQDRKSRRAKLVPMRVGNEEKLSREERKWFWDIRLFSHIVVPKAFRMRYAQSKTVCR